MVPFNLTVMGKRSLRINYVVNEGGNESKQVCFILSEKLTLVLQTDLTCLLVKYFPIVSINSPVLKPILSGHQTLTFNSKPTPWFTDPNGLGQTRLTLSHQNPVLRL